ncbi:hypothetical protein AVEN_147404-1 [Araneus ventricosus]|uniref:Uncharacterized protein n=1 Tax=Araneus ventricosus TaxID=182803 RepID=A0A4Y2DRN9_ARAVE|nr:hypothetical protein AVEN_147404-1 [Araneus ventricosus]
MRKARPFLLIRRLLIQKLVVPPSSGTLSLSFMTAPLRANGVGAIFGKLFATSPRNTNVSTKGHSNCYYAYFSPSLQNAKAHQLRFLSSSTAASPLPDVSAHAVFQHL